MSAMQDSDRSSSPGEQADLLSLTAKLYYLDGLSQAEVAEIIGVSRSSVSRLLARALETGIVSITVNQYAPRNRELEEALCAEFGLKRAVVVKTYGGGEATSVRRTVGYIAAPVISERLQPNAVVGTAGGRTLYHLIHYLRPATNVHGNTVVQMMGNIGSYVGEIDAYELGRVLTQKLNGNLYAVSAPVFAEDAATRDIFLNHAQVQTTWQLFDHVDVAFVGIGTTTNSAFIERKVMTAEDIAMLRRQGVVGEICGRFYDREGRECDSVFRDRVIGIELEKLRQIPDVIAVTNGSDRAQAVYSALRGGLATSLIIDEAGAQAVLSVGQAGSK